MGPSQILPLQVKEDLEIIFIKWYSVKYTARSLEPKHKMAFSVIPKTILEKHSYSSNNALFSFQWRHFLHQGTQYFSLIFLFLSVFSCSSFFFIILTSSAAVTGFLSCLFCDSLIVRLPHMLCSLSLSLPFPNWLVSWHSFYCIFIPFSFSIHSYPLDHFFLFFYFFGPVNNFTYLFSIYFQN